MTGLLHGLGALADGGAVLIAPDGHPQLAEAAAVAVAAYLKEVKRYEGRKAGIVLCGRNLSADALRRVL